MQNSRLSLLQGMPIFGGISEGTLKFLLDLAPVVFIPKGNYFFWEGDKAVSMFVLEQGKVAVLKNWRGHSNLLRYLGKGDCFGEMALMDLFPRSASVLALEDCSAIELSYATLSEVYEKDLEQFTMIQMNMGREVCRRLRKADNQLFKTKFETKVIDGNLVIHSI